MMASSIVKLISGAFINTNYKCSPLLIIKRHTSVIKKRITRVGKIKNRNLIASSNESLPPRDFLRSSKPYKPLENVKEKILGFSNKLLGPDFDLKSPLSMEAKFALLNTCFEELNHSVPNSLLHKIVTVEDVIAFYEIPVSCNTPLVDLQNQELPPNLHVQYDYVRFHPENDLKFKGISAFPQSSTIVTGIKYKEKYKGYKAETSPYEDTEAYIKKKFLF